MYLQKLANVTLAALACATASFGQGSVFSADGGSQTSFYAHLSTGTSWLNVQNTGYLTSTISPVNGNMCVNVYAINAQTSAMAMCCSVLVVLNETASINLTTDLARFGDFLFPDSA